MVFNIREQNIKHIAKLAIECGFLAEIHDNRIYLDEKSFKIGDSVRFIFNEDNTVEVTKVDLKNKRRKNTDG